MSFNGLDTRHEFQPPSNLCESCRLKIPKQEGSVDKRADENVNDNDSDNLQRLFEKQRIGNDEPSLVRSIFKDKTYISSQIPNSQVKDNALRQIVTRCLSLEISYDSSKPVMFGDATVGYSIVMTFKLKDLLARGSERKYAFIVTSEKETELMNHWNKIVSDLSAMVEYIVTKLNEIEKQQEDGKETDDQNTTTGDDQLSFIANTNERFYRRAGGDTQPKSICSLLKDSNFFVKLHMWACTLLYDINN
ncbi:hypothetical protein B5S30_g1899 [[Candida] boidinii]|nr:hypothetical protein B5S30_g1899 [[Candida] boidinii]